MSTLDYTDIRPYNDDEVPQVLEKLRNNKPFMAFLEKNLKKFPSKELKEMSINTCKSTTIEEFQANFSARFIKYIVDKTSDGLTMTGMENIERDQKYLFISNHRDIILDSGMISSYLHLAGLSTVQIAIGSNLLIFEWIADIVKLNKAFIVNRNANIREFLLASEKLSSYIRETIKTKKDSVWIAQREGRTKNGDDKTQLSMLKMLNMSGKKSPAESFQELNIVPVSISYEYEPCTRQKVMHTYMQVNDEYSKTEQDDLFGMYQGLIQPKGRIRLNFGTPIDVQSSVLFADLHSPNEIIEKLASVIDSQIYANYHLFPSNYIAYDILHKTNKMQEHYTNEDKQNFINYSKERVDSLDGNKDTLYRLFLSLYAKPVSNKLGWE